MSMDAAYLILSGPAAGPYYVKFLTPYGYIYARI
jgi:hypothetical protein